MNTKFDKNNNQNVNANKDMVNHPSHYQSESGLEVIDVIKAFTSNLTGIEAVSYTHLPLPTTSPGKTRVVPVPLKKKIKIEPYQHHHN